MSSAALPIASEPLVQAVPVGTSRPWVLKWTERLHAAVCGMSLMYVPLVTPTTSFVWIIEWKSRSGGTDPEQEPYATPVRPPSRSAAPSPAWATACSVAASAYCATSPIVRVVLRVHAAGRSNAVRQPRHVLRPLYSASSGSACTQFSNTFRRANDVSTSLPKGLTTPMPVTTTRRPIIYLPFAWPDSISQIQSARQSFTTNVVPTPGCDVQVTLPP